MLDRQIQAKVKADLLAGDGTMEISRRYGVPKQTISGYRRRLPQDQARLSQLRRAEQVTDMIYDYLAGNLEALQKQLEVAADVEYLRKQPAADLATLHGVMMDKACRVLEAMARADTNSTVPQIAEQATA